MKRRLLFCVWWLLPLVALSQQIDKAEYFINTDPGIGNGVDVPITAPAADLNGVSFNVDVAALGDGFHRIHFRVRDSNGKWSPTEYRTFLKAAPPELPGSEPDVVKAEYYIDVDPGIGAGVDIPITAGKIIETMTFEVPVSSLSSGFHHLYMRVQDGDGNWSPTEKRIFYKEVLPAVGSVPNLVRVEYFVDTDPGFGAATNVPITPATSVDGNFILDLSSLSQGPHILYVRAKDANDNWSLVHVENISVCNMPAPVVTVVSETISSFDFSWSAVAGATSYRLDVSDDNFETYLTGFQDKEWTDITYPVAGLTPGTAYQVRVRAVGSTCTSMNSEVVTAATMLLEPNPVSSNVTETTFDLNWASVANATSYRLDVSINDFSDYVVGYQDKPITGTSTTVTGLDGGTQYFFRLRAASEITVSRNSPVHSIKTIPAAPVAEEAEEITSNSFVATWSASNGAAYYRLDVSADNFETFVSDFEDRFVDGREQTVTGLTKLTSYKFRVRATDVLEHASGNSNIVDVVTLDMSPQTITFAPINAMTLGDEPFELTATSTSELAVTYTTSNSKVLIAGSTVTLQQPGIATIVASQGGNEDYQPAANVTRSFCINPAVPTLTVTDPNTESPLLTSSNTDGNQWYLNGTALSGMTEKTLDVVEEGSYTVVTSIEGCVSETSEELIIIVTSIEKAPNSVRLYPVPAREELYVEGFSPGAKLAIIDLLGRTREVQSIRENSLLRVNVRELAAGNYILTVQEEQGVHRIKFAKE